MLLSMLLVSFNFNRSGSENLYGFQTWYVCFRIMFAPEAYAYPFPLAMMFLAIGNIPQLIYPFLPSPHAGTRTVWVWAFSILAFVILPALVIFFQLPPSHDRILHAPREGYFVYQAGYIVSGLGFWQKRRALLRHQSI